MSPVGVAAYSPVLGLLLRGVRCDRNDVDCAGERWPCLFSLLNTRFVAPSAFLPLRLPVSQPPGIPSTSSLSFSLTKSNTSFSNAVNISVALLPVSEVFLTSLFMPFERKSRHFRLICVIFLRHLLTLEANTIFLTSVPTT